MMSREVKRRSLVPGAQCERESEKAQFSHVRRKKLRAGQAKARVLSLLVPQVIRMGANGKVVRRNN